MAEVTVGPDITGDGVNDADITPAESFVDIGGVIFTDAANTGSGTGNYNTFLAISDNDGTEEGFNSDDTPGIDPSNANIDHAKTHTVKLSDLVIVTVDGVQYYEFRVDLNESNSDPNAQISLDQFKLFSSSNGAIEDKTTLFGQNVIYDMDAGGNVSVLLSDAESSGSGNDDYAVLVPITEFAGLDPTTTYVYLYVEMGAADPVAPDTWDATATFEEWNLQNGVTLVGTKFEDLDGDGVKDEGEGPIEGVTIFIDANQNGTFDAGERSTLTDADGNYTFFGVATGQTIWIDEVVPDGATQTTGDHETVVIGDESPGTTVVVDPIGNFVPNPVISITKSAAVDGDCADTVGELITYTIVLDNTGNVALDSVVLTDAFEGGSEGTLTVTGDTNLNGTLDVGEVWRTGDTGSDNVMGVTETWTYTYVRAVTQEQIDSDGGGDSLLSDVATANAEQVNSSVAADEVTDDAEVDVCQDPALGIDKTATVDGDCADVVGELVNYTILVSNEGNVGLENVVVTDDFADAGSLDNDADDDGVIDGDTDEDGILDVGETWTYTAYHTVTQDDIDNNGNYDSDLDGINDVLRNVATANADAVTTGEAAQEVTDDATVDVCQDPALGIEKSATVDGDCADVVGELVNYTILVSNEGNVGLENVVVTDDFADAGSLDNDADDDGVIDGDTDEDGILDVGETWTYTAFHTVTQDDIDNNGNYDSDADGTNDVLRNVATANADAVTTGEAAQEVTDDATVDVCQDPAIQIVKEATVDGGCADTIGELVNYTMTVTNTGNVSLENVVVTDDFADVGSIDGDADDDGFIDGDDDMDGELDVDETWTYTAYHTVTQADIDAGGNYDSDADGFNDSLRNVATVTGDAVTTAEQVTDDDDAIVDVCTDPVLGIEKSATVEGDCADTVGELVNYTILVSNEGNVGLENVVVTDDFADVGSIDNDADDDGIIDGDTDEDGILDVGETWTYTAFHTVTQEDIDNNGNYDSDADGTFDVLRNVATANADAVSTGEAAQEVTDDATVDVCQDPALGIEKTATVPDDCADVVGELVSYTILVSNEGNVTLENVVVTDDFADVGSLDNDADDDGIIDGDTDEDGLLDVGETWTYTAYHTVTQEDIDNNGNFDSDLDGINDVLRNVATANADAVTTGEAAQEVTDDATVDVCQDPALGIDKTATVDGDCADVVGELVNYTILVSNEGNVGLENVVVTDDFADAGSLDNDADDDGVIDGDTDEDGILDVGETWTYTAYHTVTQDDIDNNGNYDSDLDGINDVLRNVATANADAVTTGEAAQEVTDDATVDVCQDPAIDLEKLVSVDSTDGTDGTFTDSDTQWGDQNVNLGTPVWFKVTVENTGNVTLTDVDIVDNNQTGGLPGTFFDLVVDGALTQNAIDNFGATLVGDDDGDGDLDVGETWTITYNQAFDPGNHVNEATVTAEATTTAEEVTDSDLAHYFSLVDTGLCPRTPGFWQNMNNGGQFWDGIVGNEKNLGKDGFPEGELLYAVDSNNDGFINEVAGDGINDDKPLDAKGLLIGDYNGDGLSAGEDTLFVSYADARSLINASNKQLNGSSGDGRFMLGRDMVASWLNYLQGSGFGDDSDSESPTHYLNDAIDWMQIYSGNTAGGTGETFDSLKLNGGAIKTSSSVWKDEQSGFDHSASEMHSALDYYNNTGQTEPGGTHYANCEDEHLFEAIAIYKQIHELV